MRVDLREGADPIMHELTRGPASWIVFGRLVRVLGGDTACALPAR